MYYYCKNSKKKIVHLASCHHIGNSDIKNIASFQNIVDAEKQGYRVCKHCAALKSYFKNEKETIEKICKESGISVNNRWSFLRVDTVYCQWKILFDEERNCLQLYHKNTYETGRKALIPNYHNQNFDCFTISESLDYIIKHDEYRHANPIRIKQGKSKNPQKGTRAWDVAQKRIKKRKKQRAIGKVLNLIDSLHLKYPSISQPTYQPA